MNTTPSDRPNNSGSHLRPEAEKKAKGKSPVKKIILFVLLALLLGGVAFGARFLFAPKVSIEETGEELSTDIFSVRDEAYYMKDMLKQTVECMKLGEMDDAEACLAEAELSVENLQLQLGSPVWASAETTPVIGKELSSIKQLLYIASDALDALVRPPMELMREYPLTEIKVDNGFNAKLIYPYIDYLEDVAPYLRDICADMQTLDLNLVDREGKISSYTVLLSDLLGVYDEYKDMLPLLRDLLGENGDRCYMIVAQNSSETRAAGGFPGAVGLLNSFDQVVYLTDFLSIYENTNRMAPKECKITDQEIKIFSRAVAKTHDSCNFPDFERMAEIIALSSEQRYEEPVHGVISMTPVIVQRILAFAGEVTLSDGTVINGENATKYLQHDLYYQYLGVDKKSGAAAAADELFAETARSTFELMLSSFSINDIMNYVNVFRQGIADRTIMVWVKDPEQQKLVREAGWSGTLNYDPMKPQAGVYFSLLTPSKLGWFLDIDTTIGDYTTNADGSRTYKMTCVLRNTLTMQELNAASAYIIGGYQGTISGGLQLFAPAGGKVENFHSDNGRSLIIDEYKGLQLGYFFPFINPGETITITYDLTTAPGVTEELTLSATPTLTAYR